MSEQIERLLVRIEANAEHFEKTMRKMNGELRSAQRGNKATLDRIERDVRVQSARMFVPMGDALKREVAGFAGVLATAFSVRQIIDYADSYTSLQNRLKAVGLEGERLKQVEKDLYDIANRNGVAIDSTTQLFQRAMMARANLGASEEQLMTFVSGTTAALRLQGTSATEASGALLQLGQLLGGAKVQATEYNSLVDNLQTVLHAVAAGSDRWGGSTTKLTKDVKDGKVTAQEFFGAALKGYGDIEKKAAGTTLTVGSALTTLNNQLGQYIGQSDQSLSATARMAQAIKALGDNLDTIVPVVITLSGIIGAGLVSSLTAAASAKLAASVAAARLTGFQIAMTASMTGATRAQVALNMAMAANPVGVVITAVAALAGGLYLLANRYNSTAVAQRQLSALQSSAETTLEDYRKAVLDAAAASGEEREELLKKAAALKTVTEARINDMRVEAQRQRAEAAAAERKATEARAEADSYRDNTTGAGMSNARAAQVFGNDRAAKGAEDYAARAKTEAEAAEKAVKAMEDALRRAESPTSTTLPPVPDDPKKPKGPTPEELARQRAQLALQMEIDLAQAKGDEAAEKAARRKLEVMQLTEQLTKAQLDGAAEVAATHVATIGQLEDEAEATRQARDIAMDRLELEVELARLRGDHAVVQQKEREIWIEQRVNELLEQRKGLIDEVQAREQANSDYNALSGARAQLLARDIAMDRLEFEAEMARLRGDPAAIQQKERELWIEQRVNELLEQRKGLIDATQAREQANSEYRDLQSADQEGVTRDMFRRAFKDGISAAIDGDIGGLLTSLANTFADQAIDRLSDLAFDMIFGSFDAAAQGAVEGAAHAATVAPAITAAGGVAAGAMGTAITAAGMAAGASMAAQIIAASTATAGGEGFAGIFSSFAGGFAKGGTFRAGQWAVVGEDGPEAIRALPGGGVSVLSNGQLRGLQVGGGASAQPTIIQLSVEEGALFEPTVRAISGQVSIQTVGAAMQHTQDQSRASHMRSGQRFA